MGKDIHRVSARWGTRLLRTNKLTTSTNKEVKAIHMETPTRTTTTQIGELSIPTYLGETTTSFHIKIRICNNKVITLQIRSLRLKICLVRSWKRLTRRLSAMRNDLRSTNSNFRTMIQY